MELWSNPINQWNQSAPNPTTLRTHTKHVSTVLRVESRSPISDDGFTRNLLFTFLLFLLLLLLLLLLIYENMHENANEDIFGCYCSYFLLIYAVFRCSHLCSWKTRETWCLDAREAPQRVSLFFLFQLFDSFDLFHVPSQTWRSYSQSYYLSTNNCRLIKWSRGSGLSNRVRTTAHYRRPLIAALEAFTTFSVRL